ncbi:MAG: 4Fe-4S binding protein [Clostridiales bacterium]|jgi:ferredoxin|nr:4Fe-4S binding protein [Clostridiales bacterium]
MSFLQAMAVRRGAKRGDLRNKADLCVYCGVCAEKCRLKAIATDSAARVWNVDDNVCVRCLRCVKGCPKGALYLDRKDK